MKPEIVNAAVEFFKEEMQTSNNVQIILPTGGGKTLIMSKVIAEYAKH
jgi:superfamily II DNA or RNA helicase